MKIDPQLQQFLAKHAPLSAAMFCGRKYGLPNYRLNLERGNYMDFYRVVSFACGTMSNKIEGRAVRIMMAALEYNRPTLYLERSAASHQTIARSKCRRHLLALARI